jgi:hypothetical protein
MRRTVARVTADADCIGERHKWKELIACLLFSLRVSPEENVGRCANPAVLDM